MSRRTKDQILQGRRDVLAVLEEEGPLREWPLIARVLGYDDVAKLHKAWPVTEIGRVTSDLNYLKRRGEIVQTTEHLWTLATSDDAVAEEDRRDVDRMLSGWQEASR